MDARQEEACKKCEKVIKYGQVIRLYDENRRHILSVLRCFDDGGFDFCTPEGKVVFADCNGKMVEFVKTLAKFFKVENIED